MKDGLIVEWAEDFPVESASGAIETWCTKEGGGTKRRLATGGRRTRASFPQDFVDRFVPEWGAMIARMTSETG